MAFDDEVEAYCLRYSKEQIETALDRALNDRASGVTITEVSYEGGSTRGVISGEPSYLIAVLNACLKRLGGVAGDAPTTFLDFSRTRLGT